MPESDATPPVDDNRVTDVDGREVDDVTLNWLTFIALHMEEENDFEDDDLLDDLLLALGYRDDLERETLRQPRQPHVIALRDTLARLESAGLISKRVDPALTYHLVHEVVDALWEVTARIGTIWSDVGADAIDSKAELGWLTIIALRIQDRNQVSRDDLDEKLASLLGDHSQDARRTALTTLLAELEDYGYTQESNTSIWRRVLGRGWALTDRAWGGVYSLRDSLLSDFAHDLLFEESISTIRGLSFAADASESDETEAQETDADGNDSEDVHPSDQNAQSPEENRPDSIALASDGDAQPNDSEKIRGGPQPLETASSVSQTPHGDVVVSNLDLCVATLKALTAAVEEGNSLTEEEIEARVLERLGVPLSYRQRPMPPWALEAHWAKDLRKKHRAPTLFGYRMEHVFRALSIEQTGLIRDSGLDQSEQDRWALTNYGRAVVASEEFHGGDFSRIDSSTGDYFRMHNYLGWQTEDWMEDVVDLFGEMGSTLGGAAFELLTDALVRTQDDIDSTTVQPSNSYLDKAGVDIVAVMHVVSEGGRLMGGVGGHPTTLLVQCKRHFRNEIPPDAPSKLFATTTWLRGQAARDDFVYDVAGARLAFLGDLSREATWTFWALKSAWDAMEEAARASESPGRKQPDLTWEIWDGQKIFQLMKEHQIGVVINDNDVVTVDEQYLRGLAAGIKDDQAAQVPRS